MQYPDEINDLAQLTMEEFVGHSQHLFNQIQDLPSEVDFIRFVLAGRVGQQAADEPDQHRITLNCLQGLPPLPQTRISRDLDSAIGISRTLPYTSALAIWPIPPFKEMLTKDNHTQSHAYDAQGDKIFVPMHKIPNVPLGKVQQRHVVRIFFPRLYSADGVVLVSQEDLALLYDHCLRPTLLEVLPEFADRAPTSYAAAYMQSKTRAGGLAFNTLDIPWNRLEEVAEILLAKLQEQKPAFRDAYFVHELRGTKGSTIHDGEKDWERQMAFEEMFEHVDVDNLNPREWLVDVALTIGVDGHVPELLQVLELPFDQAQYCVCTPDQWKMHFDRIFPSSVQEARDSGQNFPSCSYYKSYIALASTVNDAGLVKIRCALRKEFDKLAWVPWTSTDRMWGTGAKTSRAWKVLPREKKGGPMIAINPRRHNQRVSLRAFDQPDENDVTDAEEE
ncbi:hypothetical protein EV424DRAFT_1336621 [Suillus variegatus]|nr:hypothetical protein EV424DRAFT_1336621 [Suillus variegatus]